jgi:hypothetical protein
MKVTEAEFYAMKFDEVVLRLAKLILRPVSIFDFGKLLMEYLDTHLSSKIKANMKIMGLLRERGHLVFVPKTWEGIRNVFE